MKRSGALLVLASAISLSACSTQVITLAEATGAQASGGEATGGGGALPGGNGGDTGAGSWAGEGGAPQATGGSAGTGVGGGGLPGLAGFGGGYGGAEGGSAGGEFCTPSSGCGGAMYCEPDGCGVLTGTCQPLQASCDGVFEPTCGCDGLTYWNACVRAWAGVGEQHPGECDPGLAVNCNDSEPCSVPYATCVSAEPSCQSAACWVLPCPGLAPELLVSACNGSESCVDACSVAPGIAIAFDGACQ